MFEKIAHFRAASIGHWQLYTMAITTLCHAIVSFHNMNKAKSLLNFDGSMFSYCHACFQILHSSKLTQQLPYMRTCRQSCCQKPKLKLPFRPLTAEFSGRENLVHIQKATTHYFRQNHVGGLWDGFFKPYSWLILEQCLSYSLQLSGVFFWHCRTPTRNIQYFGSFNAAQNSKNPKFILQLCSRLKNLPMESSSVYSSSKNWFPLFCESQSPRVFFNFCVTLFFDKLRRTQLDEFIYSAAQGKNEWFSHRHAFEIRSWTRTISVII